MNACVLDKMLLEEKDVAIRIFQAWDTATDLPELGFFNRSHVLESVDANIGFCLSTRPPMRTRVADGSATKDV